MAKLSKHEAIGVGTALIVIFAVLFFGNSIFNGSKEAVNDAKTVQLSPAGETFNEEVLGTEDLQLGVGDSVKNGDTISVHYVGTLTDGTKFDSSYDRGEPISFTVGSGALIKGFDNGMMGMQVGGKRKLTIPPELAYGAQGAGAIPANATIVFEVELVSIQ